MRSPSYPPALLRREDAAEYLAVSPRKLDELQAKGVVIPVRLDGMKRFRRSDLDDIAAGLPDWD
ncbi:helix-turn-helix domain-containing protein [Cellulomonas denverensis]|uniref:Helix-turn-helix domain-containing protein n=1 Tax=Cellulomonas denverensis TaxID=264297 RepID=A0A7X6KTX6_9CELL|nr:helix-turn-helix domain-containing protein [Cellulomonas denverensis]NKY22236.1 helix-turn-helix domain-containing protein [Cellulomonas denverensis]GIG27206.1 hypothetical protein Cde04nite_34500 [Cellulomonas denverensis]